MKKIASFAILFFLAASSFFVSGARADTQFLDSDNDGLTDQQEITKYLTDANNSDSDGDGFLDGEEIKNNYSPLFANKKLSETDLDRDGLNDEMELKFGTDLGKTDSDGDGFSDLQEIESGYRPTSADKNAKLEMKLEVDLKEQKLFFLLGGIKWKEFVVSSGKASTPTPKGNYKITNKHLKAWSASFGLWMPYWLGLGNGKIGLHELPVWPNGYREGADHLGIPVSHGCIRLGIGDAKYLYDRLTVGTEVLIK